MGGEYAGIKEGNNDWKQPGWRCPKMATHGHRLEFKLYALDDELHLGNKVHTYFLLIFMLFILFVEIIFSFLFFFVFLLILLNIDGENVFGFSLKTFI
jgi:hypothetical protein